MLKLSPSGPASHDECSLCCLHRVGRGYSAKGPIIGACHPRLDPSTLYIRLRRRDPSNSRDCSSSSEVPHPSAVVKVSVKPRCPQHTLPGAFRAFPLLPFLRSLIKPIVYLVAVTGLSAGPWSDVHRNDFWNDSSEFFHRLWMGTLR